MGSRLKVRVEASIDERTYEALHRDKRRTGYTLADIVGSILDDHYRSQRIEPLTTADPLF